jgi:hypothetical protein
MNCISLSLLHFKPWVLPKSLCNDGLGYVVASKNFIDGMIFGLRALPNAQTGDWRCFYAEIKGEL